MYLLRFPCWPRTADVLRMNAHELLISCVTKNNFRHGARNVFRGATEGAIATLKFSSRLLTNPLRTECQMSEVSQTVMPSYRHTAMMCGHAKLHRDHDRSRPRPQRSRVRGRSWSKCARLTWALRHLRRNFHACKELRVKTPSLLPMSSACCSRPSYACCHET